MLPKKHHLNISTVLTFAFFVFLSFYILSLLYSEISLSTVPFDTDEADHATPSLELYTSIINGNGSQIFRSITRQAFYPPLYSFFVSASYFLFSPTLFASRIPTLVCLVIYIFLLSAAAFVALKGSSTQSKLSTISLLGLLAITSPITLENSILCMLEIPGLLSVSFCLLAFSRFKNLDSNKELLIAILCGLGVFFTKYNFGIITLPAIAATIFFQSGLRNTVKAGVLILLFLGLWSAVTDFSQFLHFFTGHKSYAPMLSQENIFFELNSWINSYCIHPVVASLVLCLSSIAAAKFFKAPVIKFALFNTLFAFLVLFLSTTNEERHFMVALPSLLFLGARGVNLLIEKAKNFSILGHPLIAASICILFIINLSAIEASLKAQFEGEPEFLSQFEFLFKNTGNVPVLFYGISDDFSIEALRWYYAKSAKKLYTEVRLDAYPYRDDKNFTAKMRNRNIDAPYKIPGFPKKPLGRILEQNYYQFAVHINNTQKKQRFYKEGLEFKNILSGKLVSKSESKSRQIEVYRLDTRSTVSLSSDNNG